MNITASSNIDIVFKHLQNVAKQSNYATMQAINDSAYAVRGDLQRGMQSSFQGVTPYMVRSIWVRSATKQSLTASVWPKHNGGSGYDPQKILASQVFGGDRKIKGYERALQRLGILPSGMSAVPSKACPLDGYGNPQRGALLKIISYFRAKGGAAAVTDTKRARGIASKGQRYIISKGMGKTHHLAMGVWLIDGSRVAPMLMFVKKVKNKKRFDYMAVSDAAVERTFASAYERRMASAMNTSK